MPCGLIMPNYQSLSRDCYLFWFFKIQCMRQPSGLPKLNLLAIFQGFVIYSSFLNWMHVRTMSVANLNYIKFIQGFVVFFLSLNIMHDLIVNGNDYLVDSMVSSFVFFCVRLLSNFIAIIYKFYLFIFLYRRQYSKVWFLDHVLKKIPSFIVKSDLLTCPDIMLLEKFLKDRNYLIIDIFMLQFLSFRTFLILDYWFSTATIP